MLSIVNLLTYGATLLSAYQAAKTGGVELRTDSAECDRDAPTGRESTEYRNYFRSHLFHCILRAFVMRPIVSSSRRAASYEYTVDMMTEPASLTTYSQRKVIQKKSAHASRCFG
jgi:hypothetical protein